MAQKTVFDKSLDRLKFIISTLGLVLEPRKCGRRDMIKKRCTYIFNFIWLNTELIGSIYFFVDSAKNGEDMTVLTYIAPCSMLSVVASFKIIFLIYYENYVNDLIDDLRELDENANDYNVDVKNRIEKKELRFLNFVINLLNIINAGLVINFCFVPLITIALNYIKIRELKLVLPFPIVYPFDALNIKYWPYVYLKQIWSECLVLLNICYAEYLYYICCTYTRIQFRVLSYEFENLIPNKEIKSESNESYVEERLEKLIKWHQRLIRTTNTLELIYAKSTLLNFVSSSLILCLVGFNARTIEDKMSAFSFLTFLSFSLLQIYFLCLFGDMLMKASLEISDAVYISLWYAADRKVAKDLLTVLIRAQTPCKLTAFGFGDVNLKSFSKIISTSWSYFALLNTMYADNQE